MYSNIVAGVDFSSITPIVLELAAKEAKLRFGELHLIHVIPLPIAAPSGVIPSTAGVDLTATLNAAKDELQRVAHGVALEGIKVTGHVRVGTALTELVALANEVDADLIVVGASEKGLAMRALLGSTTKPLMSRAPCSLLVARPRLVPEIEPPRADQNDDIHKRHHPRAHTYSEPPDRLGEEHEHESFRFSIEP